MVDMVVDAAGLDQIVLTRRGLQCVIMLVIPWRWSYVPAEIRMNIYDLVFLVPGAPVERSIVWSSGPRSDPAIPPENGASPFSELSPELLRKIFAESMPAKNRTIKCLCGQLRETMAQGEPRRNRVSTLMSVCRKFKEHVKQTVYEERCFEIHVHQGGTGGVELLNAGTQPLAYMESGRDDRFIKFTNEDEYGLKGMKKINIAIFPTVSTKRSKAVMFNTHFMIKAICRLLERGAKESDRIVSIKITFPRQETSSHTGRHNIMSSEHFWWDPDTSTPRCTSIHNLPDIELALHPFAMLTRVHNVQIDLPASVNSHDPTISFVDRLISGMTSRSSLPNLLLTAEQDNLIQSMRQETEEYIFKEKYGRSSEEVEKLGEDVLEHGNEEKEEEDDEGNDDGGGSSKSAMARARDASLGLTNSPGRQRGTVIDLGALRRFEVQEHKGKLYKWQAFGQREGTVLGEATQDAAMPLTGLLHQTRRARMTVPSSSSPGIAPTQSTPTVGQGPVGTTLSNPFRLLRSVTGLTMPSAPEHTHDMNEKSQVAPDLVAHLNVSDAQQNHEGKDAEAQAEQNQMQIAHQLNGDEDLAASHSTIGDSQDMAEI